MIDRNDFRAAIGAPDAGFNRAMDAALRQIREREERPVMKKKISVGLLAAIIAILTLTGAALAVGLNLFNLFGRNDERLARIAPEAELETETPGVVETEEIGKSAVEIVNAYYDGESLIVAYTVDNAETYAPFTPTEDELSRMENFDGILLPASFDGLDPVEQAYIDAVEAGEPYGYVCYSVFAADHINAGENGEIEIPPSTGDEITLEDGRRAWLVEYETPLPEEVRELETLELHLNILQHEFRVWYDGANEYVLSGSLDTEPYTYEGIDGNTYTSYGSKPKTIGEAVAAVENTRAEIRRYAGEGSCNGVPVRAEATVSAVHGSVNVTAQGEAFPDPGTIYPDADDRWLWYDVMLADETGMALDNASESVSAEHISAEFLGTGRLPEQLELYITIEGEGDWDAEKLMEEAVPILLLPIGE